MNGEEEFSADPPEEKKQAPKAQVVRFEFMPGFWNLLKNDFESYDQLFDSVVSMRQHTLPPVDEILQNKESVLQKFQKLAYKQPLQKYILYMDLESLTKAAVYPNRSNAFKLKQLTESRKEMGLHLLMSQIRAYKRVEDIQLQKSRRSIDSQLAADAQKVHPLIEERGWLYDIELQMRGK